MLCGRKDFEGMTSRKYEYIKGLNDHSKIALYVDIFKEDALIISKYALLRQ